MPKKKKGLNIYQYGKKHGIPIPRSPRGSPFRAKKRKRKKK